MKCFTYGVLNAHSFSVQLDLDKFIIYIASPYAVNMEILNQWEVWQTNLPLDGIVIQEMSIASSLFMSVCSLTFRHSLHSEILFSRVHLCQTSSIKLVWKKILSECQRFAVLLYAWGLSEKPLFPPLVCRSTQMQAHAANTSADQMLKASCVTQGFHI